MAEADKDTRFWFDKAGPCWGCLEPTHWIDYSFEVQLCDDCYDWKWKEFQKAYNREAFRVAIVGSRAYGNLQHVSDFVDRLPPNTIVVSGGASGVDTAAEVAAKRKGFPATLFPVDKAGLPPYGAPGSKAAFAERAYARNQLIVDAADVVIAFWDGKSRGTMDTVARARAAGKPVRVFTRDEHIARRK